MNQTKRSCGECTACCVALTIEEPPIEKEANEPCRFLCQDGGGCGIYTKRPKLCRGFACLWLSTDGIPEAFRPDRCGLMLRIVDKDGSGRVERLEDAVVTAHEVRPQALQEDAAQELLARLMLTLPMPMYVITWDQQFLSPKIKVSDE